MSNETRVKVVLIEDEKPIREFMTSTLEEEGLLVFDAETGRQGMIEVETRKPDLVLLDLGLPDMDGVEVIARLREWSQVPILVLSARNQETAKVAALDAGAEDYLTKPFGVAECMARIRVLLRRHVRGSAAPAQVFRFGNVSVDLVTRQVLKGGEAVHLTPIEYRLLSALIQHAGRVMTHRELLRTVWGPSFSESHPYLRVYMGHLRQKLEDSPAMPQHILTETGVGYRLVEDPAATTS